jgi:glycosyltransferase involved in cell wall biosynthesis
MSDGQESQVKSSDGIVAVVIPCYNEAITISKVVTDFRRVLPNATVYVYDNNSTDDTIRLAREAGAVVRSEPRQGKGNVVRAMLREIDADCYLLVDGDDTYPAEAAPEMVSKVLDEGYDMVDGDRLSTTYFTENKRPFHNFGNRLVRGMINLLFHSNVHDIMTGYRAMSFGFAKTLPILSRGFELETEMTIFALDKNARMTEIPIQYRDRPAGSHSKLNTVSDGIKVIGSIFNLLRGYRPLLFFSIFGVISLIITIILSSMVLHEFMATRYITHTGMFSWMFVFALLTVTLFAAGFVLSSVAKRERQDHEVNLNAIVMQWRQCSAKKERNDSK